jgi:pimeloyl-ACP methyl ester carboxylesterase
MKVLDTMVAIIASTLLFLVLEITNVLLASATWILFLICVLPLVFNFPQEATANDDKELDESVVSESITIDNAANIPQPLVKNRMLSLLITCQVLSLCAVCVAQFVAALVAAGAVSTNYVGDHVLMACLSIVLAAFGVFLLKLIRTASPPTRKCSCSFCCGAPCLLGLVIVLSFLSLWHTCMKANGLLVTNLPPGRLVKTSGNTSPAIHIWCDDDGKNKSAPTVVFLHGFLGGSLDATWVRRDPAFLKTGLRFCSLDRPGYGYSPGYQTGDTKRDFGRVAKLTKEALQAVGVKDAVLLFHSLGGYHALALAKEVEDDPNIRLLGGVAIDALVPSYEAWDKRRPSSECDINVVAPANWFWSLVQKIEPSGLTRFLYASGFNGYDTLVRMLPTDIGPKYLSNVM